MQVNTIRVKAGRTFNHPHEQFSNLRPEVELIATLDPGEDPTRCAQQLQQMAETLVEDHKTTMLRSIEDLWNLSQDEAALKRLGDGMKRAQEEIDKIRERHPQLLTAEPA